ncbi:4-(cytidine 5'-diphospho)-2-C-methyl-D-erythritol kinase [Orbus sturtevantii]|uniref:4-(cytidine 5'-diphospho)-2-C-methyl-D-erythritol kinase n=1 Tax=Orbus sturtevantii TaxID=3074109 RepID=UPI00370D9336
MLDFACWPSPAKLNLFLYITGQRADGYHNLQTLFQFIDYCDYLYFKPRLDNKICLLTEFTDVKHDDNLIVKSANLLLDYAKQQQLALPNIYGMDITINKKLPMGGGLGGGSSNAATTLVALNHLWQLALSTDQLMAIGSRLGADVAVFIFGHSAFAQGIGDQLQAVKPAENWYLVIRPAVAISTKFIFTHSELKRDTVKRELKQLLTLPFSNDCEPVVCKLYPPIESLIQLLSTKCPTRLTGTGSCIFCQCDSKEQAEHLQHWLTQNNTTVKLDTFIAKGTNQSPLTQKLIF